MVEKSRLLALSQRDDEMRRRPATKQGDSRRGRQEIWEKISLGIWMERPPSYGSSLFDLGWMA